MPDELRSAMDGVEIRQQPDLQRVDAVLDRITRVVPPEGLGRDAMHPVLVLDGVGADEDLGRGAEVLGRVAIRVEARAAGRVDATDE